MKKKTIEKTSLKVLYLEDSPPDVEIIRKLLINAGYDISMDCTAKNNEFTSLLRSHAYDVILSDFKLPGFDAFSALKLVLEICPKVPFICVSGSIGEETAIELIKQGAVDYILKDRLVRLPLAIQRALKEVNEKKLLQFAEEALQESEKYYRMFFKTSKDCVFITSVNGNWIDMNDAAIELFGYSSREELMQVKISNLYVNAEDRVKHISVIAERGYTKDYPVDLRKKDGSVIHTLITSSVRRDVDSHIIGFMGTIRDITERKRAEEALRESEDKFRVIFENSSSAMAIIERDTTISMVNKEYCRISGYEEKDVIGMSWTKQITPEDLERLEEYNRKRLIDPNSVPGHYEFSFFRKDGEIRNCLMSAGILPTNQKIICSFTDISERKKMEEALRESEDKFKYVFDRSLIGKSITSPSGEIHVNKALCEMLGYTQEELQNKKWQDITHPDDIELTQKALDPLYAGKKDSSQFIKRYIHKSGAVVWTEVMTSLRRNEENKPLYFITSIINVTERKQAEEALFENEAKYRTLVTQSPDGIFIVDLSGTFISVNKAMCDNLKYSEQELLSMKIWDIVPQQYLSLHKNRLTAIIKGESKKDAAEYEVKGKDGIVHFIEVLSAPYYKDKDIIGFQGIARDITERKRAEEVLRIKEERYRELFSNISSGVAVYEVKDKGEDFIFVDFNKTGEKLDGDRREDLIGKSIYEARPSIKEYGLLEVFKRVWKTGTAEYFPPKLYQDTRLNKWYENFVYRLPTGEIVALYNDVTEHKRIEEDLDKERNLVKALMDNILDNIYFKDTDSRFIAISKALADRFGLSDPKQAVGKTDFNFFTEEHARLAFEAEQTIIRTGQPIVGMEEKETWSDRPETWVSTTKMPLRDKEGNIVGTFGVSRDITERKKMEEQLRQMQKLEGLGTLAGGIAHDFNNILGIILAYITSTKRFQDDPKKLDLAVDTIVKAVERGKTLVQQILTFAKKTETTFGVVDVNNVVMETMTMIFETFPKILTYSQNFDKAIPHINADRSQLHQALLNLCVNARDAMPRGGVLTINTRMVPVVSLRDQLPDATASSYVCIEVSDTGEGMTKEIQKRIFEPFFTTKEIGKGTGLGLAVVFGIVQNHKGFIDVKSELGKGTTFYLYLPASQEAAPVSVKEKEETLDEILGGTETLLVVEDEEMLMISLQMVLIEKGYKVLAAGDGFMAMKIYQKRKNDIALVLTDLGLPNISGLEVCRKIKKINPNERIILATGFLDPEMKSEFLKAGIQHFLYKPYDLRKVLREVREVLDEKE